MLAHCSSMSATILPEAISFGPDDRTAVSGSADGFVKLWDMATGAEVRSFPSARGNAMASAYTPVKATDGANKSFVLELKTSGEQRPQRVVSYFCVAGVILLPQAFLLSITNSLIPQQ